VIIKLVITPQYEFVTCEKTLLKQYFIYEYQARRQELEFGGGGKERRKFVRFLRNWHLSEQNAIARVV
jgi:hypothetical protein